MPLLNTSSQAPLPDTSIAGCSAELVSASPPSSGPWMSAMAKILGPKRLREVAIPGTHDSGTYAISAGSKVAKDTDFPDWLKYILSMDNHVLIKPAIVKLKTIMASWSKAQEANFSQQLDAGIRYFDLRVQGSQEGNPPCFVHGFQSAPVTDLMNQLSTFFSTPGNEKEIVILDFQHLHNMTSKSHKQLVDMLSATFGEKLTPYADTFNTDVTLDQLWAKPHRIIVFYNDGPIAKANSQFLWLRESSIDSLWPNKQNVAELETFLDGELKKPRSKFFVLQGVLTPTEGMIARALLDTSIPNGLQSMAKTVNPALAGWLSSWRNSRINIVICDWFAMADAFVNIILQINAGTAPSTIDDVNLAALSVPAENSRSINPNTVLQQLHDNPIEANAAAVGIVEELFRVLSKDPSPELASHLQEMERFLQEGGLPLNDVVKEDTQKEDSKFEKKE